MKKTDKFLDSVIIFFLSIHLFMTHSRLLYILSPDKVEGFTEYRLFTNLFSVEMASSTMSAIIFSVITAVILGRSVKYKLIFLISFISFALLDGIGVYIYYNPILFIEELAITTGSLYYSVYTACIIISYGLKKYLEYKNSGLNNNIDIAIDELNLKNNIMNKSELSENELNILELRNKGESQKNIAKELDLSQPTVSRVLGKYKHLINK